MALGVAVWVLQRYAPTREAEHAGRGDADSATPASPSA